MKSRGNKCLPKTSWWKALKMDVYLKKRVDLREDEKIGAFRPVVDIEEVVCGMALI